MARLLRGHEARDSNFAMRQLVWMVAFDQEEALSLLQTGVCYSVREISYLYAPFLLERRFSRNNIFQCSAYPLHPTIASLKLCTISQYRHRDKKPAHFRSGVLILHYVQQTLRFLNEYGYEQDKNTPQKEYVYVSMKMM
jgi:hypothetical protein